MGPLGSALTSGGSIGSLTWRAKLLPITPPTMDGFGLSVTTFFGALNKDRSLFLRTRALCYAVPIRSSRLGTFPAHNFLPIPASHKEISRPLHFLRRSWLPTITAVLVFTR